MYEYPKYRERQARLHVIGQQIGEPAVAAVAMDFEAAGNGFAVAGNACGVADTCIYLRVLALALKRPAIPISFYHRKHMVSRG